MKIDAKLYASIGGNAKYPPYFDVSLSRQTARVFVCADWYKTWTEWRAAADIAVETAVRGKNHVFGFAPIASAANLDTLPLFVFDRQTISGVRIFLNASSIKSESEFIGALIVAEAERRIIESGGNVEHFTFTKYNPTENGTRTVVDETEDQRAAEARNIERIISKNEKPSTREQLIREISCIIIQ